MRGAREGTRREESGRVESAQYGVVKVVYIHGKCIRRGANEFLPLRKRAASCIIKANICRGTQVGYYIRAFLSDPRATLMVILLAARHAGHVMHEAAHAYVADRCGDPTARNLGRLTLNPLKHIDILGFLMLYLVGFGWAKPVPINPRNFKGDYRKCDLKVSLAGVSP